MEVVKSKAASKEKYIKDHDADDKNNVFLKMKTKRTFLYEGGEEETIALTKTIDKEEQLDTETLKEQ